MYILLLTGANTPLQTRMLVSVLKHTPFLIPNL